jgi:uncharacterized OB-fold protein
VMANQIPLVDYLVLGDDRHLEAHECNNCGARYFDRRNACASCFQTEFTTIRVANEGTLRTFTIVAYAAPGIPVPFVSGIIDCDGTSVRANIVNTEPNPDNIALGMKVRLTTFPIGLDDAGVEAVGFGYEPVG